GRKRLDGLFQRRPLADLPNGIPAVETLFPAVADLRVGRGYENGRRRLDAGHTWPSLDTGMTPSEPGDSRGTGQTAHSRDPPSGLSPWNARSLRSDMSKRRRRAKGTESSPGGTRRCLLACLMALSGSLISNPYAGI